MLIRCSTMELFYTLISSQKLPGALNSQITLLETPQVFTGKISKMVMLLVCPSFVIKLVPGWVKQLHLAHTGYLESST